MDDILFLPFFRFTLILIGSIICGITGIVAAVLTASKNLAVVKIQKNDYGGLLL